MAIGPRTGKYSIQELQHSKQYTGLSRALILLFHKRLKACLIAVAIGDVIGFNYERTDNNKEVVFYFD